MPGRDRTAVSGPTAPVYSYYAGRAGSAPGSKKKSYTAAHGPSERTNSLRAPKLRIGLHTVIVLGCAAVGLVCLVKLVAITADAKIMLVDASESAVTQQRTEAYSQAANALLKSSVLNRTKLTLDSNGIAHTMLAQFPELTSVVVTAPLVGNRPVVYVSAAKPAFNLQTSRGLYSMDGHGFVLEKLATPDPDLTLLTETSNRIPEPGKQYLATSIVSFCETVAYELQKAGGKTVHYIDLPAARPYQVDVYLTGSGYRTTFNLKEDPLQQSGAALATMQKLAEGGGQPREYIDVRVPGRVYYK